MQNDYWNDFYRTGSVSDYLKYVDSSKSTTSVNGEFLGRENQSYNMETNHYAGKSDRDGAVGNTGW